MLCGVDTLNRKSSFMVMRCVWFRHFRRWMVASCIGTLPTHTPALGAGARAHPASLKREQEGGHELWEEFTGSVCWEWGDGRPWERRGPTGTSPSLGCWHLGSPQGREEPCGCRGPLSLRAPSRGSRNLKGKVSVSQSCPMDSSRPGSSVLGILQAGILEWVAISFSRRSSRSRTWPQHSWISGRFLTIWATTPQQRTSTFIGSWWEGVTWS